MDSPTKPWIPMQRLWIVTCGQDGGSGSTEVSSNLYTDIDVAHEAFITAVCSWHETYSTSAVWYELFPESGAMSTLMEAVVLDDGTLITWHSLGESVTPEPGEAERMVEAGIDISQVEE